MRKLGRINRLYHKRDTSMTDPQKLFDKIQYVDKVEEVENIDDDTTN